MIRTARVGILGGTLDPVHIGHVEAARGALVALALERVIFIPSRVPPHRQTGPAASPYHRFAMAALATNPIEGLEVSDIELSAPGPSFTADTLSRLHATGLRPEQIFFISGADAFAEIETWSRYPHVLSMAHFVVVSRPGHPADALPASLPALANRMVAATREAALRPEPSVFLVDALTPDVSSTDIRQRLGEGESIDGLVPAAVEQHIRRHLLYSSATPAHGSYRTADHLHDQN
jgi:nicotinate-nucleotide adenylyltransferase